MNVLGLVFSLLLILSYGFYACWDKQWTSSKLRKTYVGNEKVFRKVLNHYQSEVYGGLRGKGERVEQKEEEISEEKEAKLKTPDLNRECSRLNLWPLIQEGKDNHPLLYELVAKMIRTFYTPLHSKEKRFEYHFLDALLKAARATQQPSPSALEKIDMDDPALQRIYYKMLKGTKEWDLAKQIGYPSLLDYAKAEPTTAKLCIFHAHPDLITVIFNPEIAAHIYKEIHQEGGPLLTQELIERICSEHHLIAVDKDLLEFLELGRPHHEQHKKSLIASDNETQVCLRKSFHLKG